MAKISETELQRRLRRASGGGANSGPTATKVGSTWEYTSPVLYLAYADSLTNLDLTNNTISNQSDAVGFSMSPFNASGTLRQWRGYLFSKSMYASGDPTDYIWEDVTAVSSTVSYVREYSTDAKLQTYMGDPTNPGAGVTWASIATGSPVPSSAFWVAEKYTFNGTTSSWVLFPVKSREVGTPLASYTITGRNKPALSSSQWSDDTLVAMSSHTGETYSSVKEFGYGTAVVIKYDDGKQYGLYKKNSSGVGEWVAPADFIDGDLLVDGTINADKLMANSIQAGHITVTGSNAVTPSTISAASQSALDTTNINVTTAQTTADSKTLPTEVAAAVNNNTTTIDGAKITTGSISAAHIDAAGLTANEVTLLPYEVGAGSNTGSSRMEITSDVIKIYNGGTLRVKLGNLA